MQRIVIIGAGPTGLGAAYRLQELGHDNFIVLDKNSYIGGLASSFRERGFTWDIGGHVVFSHFEYFDRLLEQALKGGYSLHEREAWIWMMKRFVPYPFQNNIRYLPKEELFECLLGVIEAQRQARTTANFREWILATFGEGIAKYFMLPYNFKVWAHPPEQMDKGWIAERVSVIDYKKILKNVVFGLDDLSWGPNNRFKFPNNGGTGEIFRSVAEAFLSKIKLNSEIVGINTEKKILTLKGGETVTYDSLISTMPLDLLLKMSDLDALKGSADMLVHSSGMMVGIGIRGSLPGKFATKCWNYFPEGDCPFYRVTVFSNYSPNHAPKGCWSLLTETSYSGHKPADKENMIRDTVRGLISTEFLSEKDEIADTWCFDVGYSYPVPTLARDAALKAVQPELMRRGIFSRGRFGAWKYEIANMDHSVMQGVEAADRIISGKEEKVWTL